MKTLKRLSLLVVLLVIAAGYAFWQLSQPFAAFSEPVFVDFPKGTSSTEMARLLVGSGVIAHEWTFLAARALHFGRKLQAGEYRFAQPASVLDVYNRIARGDVFYYTLAVPEGQNMFDIATDVEKLKVFSSQDFLTAARDASSIRDLDPTAPTLEGYLFPSSYQLSRHTSPQQLCQMMTSRFRAVWKELGAANDAHATVTLASLVEREARVPEDRPLIASVFQNRLRVGMKLDCDPTTIYAALLQGKYRGTIHQSDLANKSLYNTYQHSGLPPGPIANPGRDSLMAALHPADTKYVYFVLRPDGSGAHNFSKSLSEHLVATARYRRVEEKTARRPDRREKAHRSR